MARELHILKDIPALRQLAGEAFTQESFSRAVTCADAGARFYAQWIENAVRGTFDRNARCFAQRQALSVDTSRCGVR